MNQCLIQKKTTAILLFGSITLANLVFAVPAQAFLVWNLFYTANNVNNGSVGNLSATLTTNGTAYSTGTTYTIQSATGFAGSNPISLYPTGVTFPSNGAVADNTFQWNGSNGIILSFDGIAFQGPTGFVNNLFNSGGLRNFAGPSYTNVVATNVSITPVPFESNSLPIIGSALFFGGGLWLKNKRQQAKVKVSNKLESI